jgi:flagellar motor switch protein FliM
MAEEAQNTNPATATTTPPPPPQASAGAEDSAIESILGINQKSTRDKTGLDVLIERSKETYEKLPMLEVIFDRYVRSISTSLRSLTADNVNVSLVSIKSIRFEDYINSVPMPAIMVIFQAVEWENLGLVTIDSNLTYALIDILLGGARNGKRVSLVDGRPFTLIEQEIVKNTTKVMLDDLSSAFNIVAPVSFRFERLENNPRFATITRPSNAVIMASVKINMNDSGGVAEFVLPYTTIEPVKELLLQMFAGEAIGNDDSWKITLSDEVKQSEVKISAELGKKNISLKELSSLKVGSTLILDKDREEPIKLTYRDIPIFMGKIGSFRKNYAVNISQKFERDIKNIF